MVRTCAFHPGTDIEDLRYSNALAELLSTISSTTSPTNPISLLNTLLISITISSSSSSSSVACRPGKPAQKTSVPGLVLPLHLRLSTVQGFGGEVEEILEVDSAEVHGGGTGVPARGYCVVRHDSPGWWRRCVAARQEYTDTLLCPDPACCPLLSSQLSQKIAWLVYMVIAIFGHCLMRDPCRGKLSFRGTDKGQCHKTSTGKGKRRKTNVSFMYV